MRYDFTAFCFSFQVRTVARIVQGDAGKVICKEAEKLKPAAVVMGTRGRSLIQRYNLNLASFSVGFWFSDSYMYFILVFLCSTFYLT